MPIQTDPLSQVYDALWGLAEASALFKSLVRLNNRVKYRGTVRTSVDKEQVTEGDLPEVALVISQKSGNLRSTSSSTDVTAVYEWWVSTGDEMATRSILPVLWAVYCAMADWPSVSQTLRWGDKTFIKRLNMGQGTIGLTDVEKNRGVKGFSSIWSTEVYMVFSQQDVLAQNDEV